MSEQIREQISAFLDGELPNSETELLLKRLVRDAELREGFGRYAVIGEAMRGAERLQLTRGFSAKVNGAIDGEPVTVSGTAAVRTAPRWWRAVGGGAVAAAVAVVAVVALQQRANSPTTAAVAARPAALAANSGPVAAVPAKSEEPVSYTVPRSAGASPVAAPGARLTNYVFAHSQYPSLLGQRDVLTDLIAEVDDPAPSPDASAAR